MLSHRSPPPLPHPSNSDLFFPFSLWFLFFFWVPPSAGAAAVLHGVGGKSQCPNPKTSRGCTGLERDSTGRGGTQTHCSGHSPKIPQNPPKSQNNQTELRESVWAGEMGVHPEAGRTPGSLGCSPSRGKPNSSPSSPLLLGHCIPAGLLTPLGAARGHSAQQHTPREARFWNKNRKKLLIFFKFCHETGSPLRGKVTSASCFPAPCCTRRGSIKTPFSLGFTKKR